MVGRLCDIIPDVDDLLRLEPEELAGIILEMISAPRGPTDAGISLDGFINQALASSNAKDMRQRPTFRQPNPQVERAVIEAWCWVESEGFLAPEPDVNGRNGYRFITRKGREHATAEKVAAYRKARALPWELIHASIRDKVWSSFLRGDHDTAVFQAFKEVEVAVRAAGHFAPELLGTDLMRKAFAPEGGPLTDGSAPKGEREALAHLFAGAIGSYKNPQSHRQSASRPPKRQPR